MSSRTARLLMALFAAVLLHSVVLLVQFQPRTSVPAPDPTRGITVSLTAVQSGRNPADNRHPRDVRGAEPKTVSDPPVVQPAVEPRVVKSAPQKVQKSRKSVVESGPSVERKKSAVPVVKAKTATEDAATSTATFGNESSQYKSSPAADVVVVKAVPIYRDNPSPKYPPLARRRGLEGTVFIEAIVSTTGRVVEAGIGRSSGHRLLDLSALKAVNRWSFIPGTVNSRPAEMRVTVPVHFTLQ